MARAGGACSHVSESLEAPEPEGDVAMGKIRSFDLAQGRARGR
jgi:hypothetical protein